MEVDALVALLDAGDDLVSVTNALGRDCLAHRDAVRSDQYAALADTVTDLQETVASESVAMWDADGSFRAAPSPALRAQLAKVWATPDLATVTVLEGICLGAGRLYFANTRSIVAIERGSVVPLPERWLPGLRTTPNPATVHPNLLARRSNCVLWELDWTLELDFTFRDHLDLVCAPRAAEGEVGRARRAHVLPKIATVHPLGHGGMALPDVWVDPPNWVGRGRFFGVHPTLPDAHRQAFEALAAVGAVAQIAVLPEFCLHTPGGLDALLAGSRDGPELVVAGSAHASAGQGRSNTSHVFLGGVRILRVAKHVPFVIGANETLEYVEDIAPLPRVLRVAAGTATRLAVAICADVNSPDLLSAMTWAGVNLLLSPSWTPKIGVAAAGLLTLAGYCQCVGVVANTPEHQMAPGRQAFWACTVVPREDLVAERHDCPASPPAVGVLDPNLPPTDPGYWTWIPLSREKP